MNISKMFYRSLIVFSLLLPALANADQILDKIEIVQTATEADIHIDFYTQVRYLRHTPTKQSSTIQVFLEFPQLTVVPTQRETLVSPPSDLVPAFKVTFPDQKSNRLGIRFDKPVKFRVTPDNSGRGIVIHVPLSKVVVPVAPEVIAPEPVVMSEAAPIELPGIPAGMSTDEYAKKLLAEGRVASGLGDYSKAIQVLNAVLNLPQHAYTQEAQELIGMAREKNGELAKAKAEYDLYLKLYPEGDGAKRVRQHLVGVETASKAKGTAKAKKPIRDIHETTVTGSWDQYYYDAHSHNYNPSPQKNSTTHDQSSLMSSINLMARSRQNQYDSRIVFRNRQTMDFIPAHDNLNSDRTDAAYVEVANSEVDYLVRAGRQSGNTGGVLGRFDGGLFRYGISPKLKVNLVAGDLVEYKVNYKRSFYGVNVDVGPIAENWSGNAFFITQEVGPGGNSITDRRAVGGDLRYSKGGLSIYSNVDYDTLFDRLNTVMVQGNWQQDEATNYNVLFDQRKSPILTMVNSLSSDKLILTPKPTSINQALSAGLTLSQLQQFAIDTTLDTDLYLIGMTRQVTPRWQLGGDVQMSRTSGTPGASAAAIALFRKNTIEITGVEPTALELQLFSNSAGGNGNIWTYHAQAVGIDTIFKDDTSIISGSFTIGETSKISSLILSNMMVPADKWRLDSSFKLMKLDSWSTTTPTVNQYVVSPTVKASYRLRENTSLEAEVGLEVTNVNDPINGHSRTFRDFSYIGYRIDI
jgi:hypothetical protein